ncbi:hypothetical protein AAC387_Pa10g1100 [Persea americana]
MEKQDLLICATLTGETPEEMLASMTRAREEGANLAQLNFHSSHSIDDVQKVIHQRILPVIVYYSLNTSLDLYEESEETKCFEVLRLALELGAEFVEIDLAVANKFISSTKLRKHSNSKMIVSHGGTPLAEELGAFVHLMQSTGADIIKITTDAVVITDVAPIFRLLSQCQVPLIASATGDRGLISQLLSRKFGGYMVYGSVGGNSIPGLPTLASLRHAYKLEYMNADTKVFGLISNPVGHSKGPILHNPAFRHAGYNGIYVPMRVDDLKEFFRVYSGPEFAGFSVGIPYKEAIVGCCDEVDPLAQSIGAVNTIVRRPSDWKLIGYNTDCEAGITAIEDALRARPSDNEQASQTSPLAGKLFVLIGAGGAGRALAFGAKIRGARIVIFDIDYERAKSLATAVSGEARPFKEKDNVLPEKGMILANATPVGMHPNSDKTPVTKEVLGAYDLVFDSVYTPRNTRLLKEAEEVGAIAVSGVEMFIRQAIDQFKLFTGGEAPQEFMRKIVLTQF